MPVSINDTWWRESKKGQKKCHVLFEWPLRLVCANSGSKKRNKLKNIDFGMSGSSWVRIFPVQGKTMSFGHGSILSESRYVT